jgi:hypothetical protein
MSKRSKQVKAMWRGYNVIRNLPNPAPSLREWARLMAPHASVVAAWLGGKCKACHRQATA